jgi:hypothetical protein
MTNVTKRGPGRPPKRTERPTRIPVSGGRKRMHINEEDKDPNFHYAWINDVKDLIFRFKRAGYENVMASEISSWGSPDVDAADPAASVISMKVNADVTAYLMKQPMEFYKQDRAEFDAKTDEREAGMKHDLNSGKEGTYGEVKFS